MDIPTIETKHQPQAVGARLRAFLRPLAVRNFRLLWLGESVSLLGDQFYLIALPWITLQLTGSGLALGSVLMVAAVPRLIFMLLGGALTDRFSPRALMLVSNAVRALLAATLAGLLFADALTLPALYICSFAFGLIDAFFHPAMLAIVPRLVEPEQLEPSNAVLQGTGQLSGVVGPALAGLLVAAGGSAAAFALDTATFAFATLMLALIRPTALPAPTEDATSSDDKPRPKLLGSIAAGLREMWSDPPMRLFLLLIVVINFVLIGPITIGIPALAALRFAGSAAGFGAMMATYGAGAVLGTVAAGARGTPRRMGMLLLGGVAALGIGLACLGLAPNVAAAAAVLGAMGIGISFVNVNIISWLQRRSPPALLGRVMSVVMLAVFGLDPLSRVVAGLAVDVSTPGLFVVAGALLALIALGAGATRAAREIA
jgi:MFS family permease